MPASSGELHARRNFGPRIIAMTADAMKEDREICLIAGMDDYVSQPIRVGKLVKVLSQCIPLGSSADRKTTIDRGDVI